VDTLTDTHPRSDDRESDPAAFRRLLANTLVASVTTTFVWFALTFWVYLETRSVVATGVIGGAYGLVSAAAAPMIGTYVDRHRKHTAMLTSGAVTAACFAGATVLFLLVETDDILSFRRPWFWLLVLLVLGGSVVAIMRSIALSTCVTLLVPADRRDRANGLVGTVNGVAFAVTSVFSGLVIGRLGMGWALGLAMGLTVIAVGHLATVHIAEDLPAAAHEKTSRVDIRGGFTAVREVPGLMLLVGLSAFNNLLGGVFMALMDAYGLSIVSVEVWGLLWGFISTAFIVGGLIVARIGLGSTPVRILVLCNLANWAICATFTLRTSIVMLTVGMFIWLVMMPIIEAAEQTVLQRAIPFERQGRVFGFAQMVESAASPITAICVGPFAESVVMPFMTDGKGADWIGGWFGTGPERGIALVFTMAGLLGVIVTLLVRSSRSYRRLVSVPDVATAALPA
jgi:DHA3 family multidrug efflux protein-like MFS transporter